ncbi:hypothetical protein QFC24_004502 [Naganishia onofrii]|uniref:Uncharacterized protein n=1 Tax=Naganishia onofrii TaxID=1851511 RepID=A0ACC2XEW4_9TREE|nr:hypothetical protein QFC24_004502 [Naganishia onofrii]
MSQEITKAKFILGGQDQQLVDNLLKIFSNWATEIRKFNDEGPKIRTDGIITAWRQKSDAAQAKAIAESRSLESDGDIERSFKPYVSCLKCFLKESNFATYMDTQNPNLFHYEAGNGHVHDYTLEELIQKAMHPQGTDEVSKQIREKTKIVNVQDTMRLLKMLWNDCVALPFPDMDDELPRSSSVYSAATGNDPLDSRLSYISNSSSPGSSASVKGQTVPMMGPWYDDDLNLFDGVVHPSHWKRGGPQEDTPSNKRVKQSTPPEIQHDKSGAQDFDDGKNSIGPSQGSINQAPTPFQFGAVPSRASSKSQPVSDADKIGAAQQYNSKQEVLPDDPNNAFLACEQPALHSMPGQLQGPAASYSYTSSQAARGPGAMAHHADGGHPPERDFSFSSHLQQPYVSCPQPESCPYPSSSMAPYTVCDIQADS